MKAKYWLEKILGTSYMDKYKSLSSSMSDLDTVEVTSSHPCHRCTTWQKLKIDFWIYGLTLRTLEGYLAAARTFCTSSFPTVPFILAFPCSVTTVQHIHQSITHQSTKPETGKVAWPEQCILPHPPRWRECQRVSPTTGNTNSSS